MDFDTVELSNLQRQIVHGTGNVGQPKTLSAQETIRRLNPHVEVVAHHTRLRPKRRQAGAPVSKPA